MTIADPHAIPETAEACTEYMTEADAAWTGGDTDRAWALYHSAMESQLRTDEQRSLAGHRLALIAINRGDHESARNFIGWSNEPGAADVLRSLDNAEHAPAPDADHVPATIEESDRAWEEGVKAKNAGDFATAARWFGSLVQSPALPPDTTARAMVVLAMCLHQTGDDASARQWLESALPRLTSEDELVPARELAAELGVHTVEPADASPALLQFNAGIEGFELGDVAAARTAFEAALHLDGATDELKGRTEYYLGSMAYQAKQYADARDRLERAAQSAPDPEKSWAHEMLQWRWEEA